MMAQHGQLMPIIGQHAEETAILRSTRTRLVTAGHVRLRHLGRLDERLAAHLDGLAVAGQAGWKVCLSALARPGVGEVFAAAVRAIEDKNLAGLDRLFTLTEAVPEALPGLLSAFGWVPARHLQGTIKQLLASDSAFHRELGLAACAMHRVDPGPALEAALVDPDVRLRARGLRAVSDCGRPDLLPAGISALSDDDPTCSFWAARSGALLGDRHRAVAALMHCASLHSSAQLLALRLVLKMLEMNRANPVLKELAQDPSNSRLLIFGAGTVGDPYYVIWLIKQMADTKLARLAGEAFSQLAGIDLAALKLDRGQPEGIEFRPGDDPDDESVAMDDDDGLPWPDPSKVQAWWDVNQHRFQPGVRYFMGEPPTVEHCKKVLREGYQRQRIAAAEYLCLLQPGTKLFPTSAPAWRQERWLKQMG
jgi:uncharacterized protein (TIGR02270 family)